MELIVELGCNRAECDYRGDIGSREPPPGDLVHKQRELNNNSHLDESMACHAFVGNGSIKDPCIVDNDTPSLIEEAKYIILET